MQSQAGDDLIERIRMHPADDDVVGPAANDLLSELYKGYPVENLGRLLHSDDDLVVRTGTWVLSELGELAAPMMDEVPALLASPIRNVRYFAIEVVLLNADERHGPAIASVMRMSMDYDAAVRWKVLEFLSEASTDQLEAGASSLEAGPVKTLADWLVRQDDEEPDPGDVLARLQGPDPMARLFAAAAAARLSDEDRSLLEHALTAEDEEIRSFAQERLSEN
ncbi:hypothetical protein [Nonomuraea jiangxiensis]|uniref:HEAT repeat-containing protein n=1 Tax=Nonomuraea jiangxiensis TaxID=633440 RepID=A0A1G8SZE9_9ACTN|nr:hypothetical protein [Nonomuraea jiangxiensis]SDJ34611.1 hypothetical protein SAMN05421869_11021 [Nonomuraea jiangxiensis]